MDVMNGSSRTSMDIIHTKLRMVKEQRTLCDTRKAPVQD
jgi:hypothetical protein